MHKSIDALAVIFGALKSGAAYVPVDPGAPSARGAYIMSNCAVKVVVIEAEYAVNFRGEIGKLGSVPATFMIDGVGGGKGVSAALDSADSVHKAASIETVEADPVDLAYILYTSGSTGRPKGVMLSHDNAVSFVDWCSATFEPQSDDRFSSHAPFHFDLSILDIYVCVKHGATLVLISESLGKDASRLAQVIADERITIWYSAPSILSLLAQFGDLRKHDYSMLRQVLFAGEVFPVKHLRTLCELLPEPRYFNLYGPTETNVCTWYEVNGVPEDDTPLPIGRACPFDEALVLDERLGAVPRGGVGELWVRGASVMQGYWGRPDRTALSLQTLEIAPGLHDRAYRTGDLVRERPDGNLEFLGRSDHQVKTRGYRVELGEIESRLAAHPLVEECVVLAIPDEEITNRLAAVVVPRAGAAPGADELKTHCAATLPRYMVPETIEFRASLPRTSSGKVDRRALAQS